VEDSKKKNGKKTQHRPLTHRVSAWAGKGQSPTLICTLLEEEGAKKKIEGQKEEVNIFGERKLKKGKGTQRKKLDEAEPLLASFGRAYTVARRPPEKKKKKARKEKKGVRSNQPSLAWTNTTTPPPR